MRRPAVRPRSPAMCRASSRPSWTLRSSPAVLRASAGVRTEWSRARPRSQTGYQMRSARAATACGVGCRRAGGAGRGRCAGRVRRGRSRRRRRGRRRDAGPSAAGGEQAGQPVVGQSGQGGTARRPGPRLLVEEAQPGRRVAAGSRVLGFRASRPCSSPSDSCSVVPSVRARPGRARRCGPGRPSRPGRTRPCRHRSCRCGPP